MSGTEQSTHHEAGFVLLKDVAVPMRDGALLRANVFRPERGGPHPVIMTFGPYGKDVHLSNFFPDVWEGLRRDEPGIFAESSGRYMGFETPDPEVWVRRGYVLVKVDSRGAGKSPGRLDVNSPEEFRDFHDAIEWAAGQPWSTGRIGLLGISYYAAGQWVVAGLRPPHLAAILPWQGTPDFYRGRTRTGGIFCNGFVEGWLNRSVHSNQHGNPGSRLVDLFTGARNTGPASLSEAELRANRADYVANIRAHPLLDDWYRARIARLDAIEVPALVVANWGGLGLHLAGTIAGFGGIASRDKWLRVQSGSYFATFFRPESVAMQARFLDRYLKDADNGWEAEPRVEVAVRSVADGTARVVRGAAWPLPGTRWTRLHLDAADRGLKDAAPSAPASVAYPAPGEGVTFTTGPLAAPLEIAGPIAARLHVSCAAPRMDLFLTLLAFAPDGTEVTFFSATEPRAPVSQGWMRVALRRTDPARSTAWQPHHPFDTEELLVPGEVYAVDVEIWPASVALPAGHRLELVVQGRDFERPGSTGIARGSGFFTHTDPVDRPPDAYGGEHRIHTGPETPCWLLLPALDDGDEG